MRIPGPARRCAIATALSGLTVLAAGCGASPATSPSSAGSASASSASARSASASASPFGTLTAKQILLRAVANLNAASSVRMSGSLRDSAQTYVVNLAIGTKGCTGTIAVHGQGSLWLLKIGKTVWVKPDPQFYKSVGVNATALSLLSGKYLEVSASSNMGSVSAICTLDKLDSHGSGANDHVVKGPTTTVLGQPALQIEDTTQPGTAYVTISAHPELLRIGDSADGYVDFTDYNAPLTLTRPPALQTLDGAQYGF